MITRHGPATEASEILAQADVMGLIDKTALSSNRTRLFLPNVLSKLQHSAEFDHSHDEQLRVDTSSRTTANTRDDSTA